MRDTQIRVPTRRASGSGSAAGRPLFATRGPSLALRSGRDDPGCGQGRIGGTGFKNQRGAKARGRDGLDSARPGPRPPCPPRAAHSRWRCPQGPPRPARPPARGQLTGCARRLPVPQPARMRQPPTSGGFSALSAQGAAWQGAESGGSERWTRGCGPLRGGRVSSETTESRLSVNCSPRCGLRAGPPRIPWGNAAPRRRQQEVGWWDLSAGAPRRGRGEGAPGCSACTPGSLHPGSGRRGRRGGGTRPRPATTCSARAPPASPPLSLAPRERRTFPRPGSGCVFTRRPRTQPRGVSLTHRIRTSSGLAVTGIPRGASGVRAGLAGRRPQSDRFGLRALPGEGER